MVGRPGQERPLRCRTTAQPGEPGEPLEPGEPGEPGGLARARGRGPFGIAKIQTKGRSRRNIHDLRRILEILLVSNIDESM